MRNIARFDKLPALERRRLEIEPYPGETTARTGIAHGVSDVRELLAHAFVQPKVKKFLLQTEIGKTGINIWDKLTELIGKLYNIRDPQEADLLNRIMQVGSRLMEEQKRTYFARTLDKRPPTLIQPSLSERVRAQIRSEESPSLAAIFFCSTVGSWELNVRCSKFQLELPTSNAQHPTSNWPASINT